MYPERRPALLWGSLVGRKFTMKRASLSRGCTRPNTAAASQRISIRRTGRFLPAEAALPALAHAAQILPHEKIPLEWPSAQLNWMA